MSKTKVDDFLEVFSEGELLDLVLSAWGLPLEEEEEEKEEEEKKKRKKRKARVKKDSPKPEIIEEEVDEEGRGRRRRRRNKPWGAISTDTKDFNPFEGRRRRRGEKVEVKPKIEPKIIPHPIPERQAELQQLTQEIAKGAAQKFLDCIPPEMKEVLTEEQLKFQQSELSVGIANTLKSQLDWALNQAWLDAKKNNASNSVD